MIGKALGVFIGLFFGFWYAVLGLIIGGIYDGIRAADRAFLREAEGAGLHSVGNMDQIALTVGVVVLSAKMAKVDGVVTRDEINMFKRVFRIPEHLEAQIGQLFDQARNDSSGYESYAEHLARLFSSRSAVLEELLSGLMLIAASDRPIQPSEELFLRDIAKIFGFSAYEYGLIAARSGAYNAHHSRKWESGFDAQSEQAQARPSINPDDPYVILGVSRTDSASQIKTVYRRLIMEHHPDKLVAAGMAPDFVAMATEKMKRINAAYDQICKEKGSV